MDSIALKKPCGQKIISRDNAYIFFYLLHHHDIQLHKKFVTNIIFYTSVTICAQEHVWKDISIKNWKSFIVRKQWLQAAIFPLCREVPVYSAPYWANLETFSQWHLMADFWTKLILVSDFCTKKDRQLNENIWFLSNSNTKINTYDFKKSMLIWTLKKEIWIITGALQHVQCWKMTEWNKLFILIAYESASIVKSVITFRSDSVWLF